MHDGWRTVTLGEFTDVAIERQRVSSDSEYPIAGVLNAGRGLFDRGSMVGRETSYPVLHQLRAGRVVMRKLTAWEGTVAVVPRAFNGFHVSTEFPTFRLDDRCILTGFMGLICQYPPFWEALKDRSTGTVQRRKRVSPSAFLTVPILLPPLADQRRIVDLIGAIDECLRAVGLQQTSVAAVITSFRETRLEELAAENVDLGQVLVGIEAGRSPAAKDRPPQSSERAVLKVSAIRSGEFDPAEVKTVDSLTALPEASRVRVGDVLMTRANTRDLVGSVCIVDEIPDNYYLCDKTLRLVPALKRVAPDFLVEVLQSGAARAQIELSATGTSASMKNISQSSIRSVRIPLPTMKDQFELGTILAELRIVAKALQSEVRAFSEARSVLLDLLLSGRHRIPDSYDTLLEPQG